MLSENESTKDFYLLRVFLILCKFESLIFCQIWKVTFFLRRMHSLLPLSRPLLIAGLLVEVTELSKKVHSSEKVLSAKSRRPGNLFNNVGEHLNIFQGYRSL